MPRPSCIVCSDTKRRPQIDAALQQGSTVTYVSERFKIEHESVRRHARNHLGIAGPSGKAKTPNSAPAALAIAALSQPSDAIEAPPVEVVPIRTQEAIVESLEWVVASSKRMHAEAQASKNWTLANDALTQVVNALDKLAKGAKLYTDGTIVNVDTVEQKTLNVFAELSTEQLRAMKGASPDQIRALVGGLVDGE
jgi:hypothetical protein